MTVDPFANFDTESTVRKALSETNLLAKASSPSFAADTAMLPESLSAALVPVMLPIHEVLLDIRERLDMLEDERTVEAEESF